MTAENNREVYGKCNNPYGHGHDYVLHVSVEGTPGEKTGRIVNPGALDRFVQERVVGIFQHRDINSDVAGFQGVPTTENLAIDIERRLRGGWKERFSEIELDRIRIEETPRNTFELTRTQ